MIVLRIIWKNKLSYHNTFYVVYKTIYKLIYSYKEILVLIFYFESYNEKCIEVISKKVQVIELYNFYNTNKYGCSK